MGPPEVVTTEAGLASLVERLEERACVRPGHRVPSGEDLLASPGTGPGGLAEPCRRRPAGRPGRPLGGGPRGHWPGCSAGPWCHGGPRREPGSRGTGPRLPVLPSKLFDTQVAAGFVGYGSASLASLVRTFLARPPGQRRPAHRLEPSAPDASQVSYAASDVAYLLALADAISAQLEARGRLTLGGRGVRHPPGSPAELDGSHWSMVEAAGQPPASGRPQGRSRRSWLRGERKRPAPSTCSPGWCWPTWLCSRSPIRHLPP